MRQRWTFGVCAAALLLSGCGSGAPRAPLGLDRRPANPPASTGDLRVQAPEGTPTDPSARASDDAALTGSSLTGVPQ